MKQGTTDPKITVWNSKQKKRASLEEKNRFAWRRVRDNILNICLWKKIETWLGICLKKNRSVIYNRTALRGMVKYEREYCFGQFWPQEKPFGEWSVVERSLIKKIKIGICL